MTREKARRGGRVRRDLPSKLTVATAKGMNAMEKRRNYLVPTLPPINYQLGPLSIQFPTLPKERELDVDATRKTERVQPDDELRDEKIRISPLANGGFAR